ncbi:hypothetical protein PM082_020915 [Marasmius tenuissimus]|nr:hypothetical protein PM082_020915 [Marasmius tenuissimus]
MTVPLYQCEISPGHSRGKFVCIEYFFLNCGYMASAWIGYAFFLDMPSEVSWRGPYAVQAAFSLLLISMSFLLPETPRWLIKNGFKTEGLWTLADLHAGGDITDHVVTQTYHEIVDTLEFEQLEGANASWTELFTRYTKRTLIGFTAQMFAQLNGINAILHFLPENLDRAGFTIADSLLHSGGCAVLYCAGAIPSILFIDKLGRRCFLLVGSVALAVSLAVAGGLQFFVNSIPEGRHRHWGAEGIFCAFGVYLFIYGATWGPTPWLLGAEIFPTRARAKGVAIATASDWFFNFVVGFVTPPLFDEMPGGYYFLLVGACLLSFPAVFFFYPETAHSTLEELGEVFGDELPPRRLVEEEKKGEAQGESRLDAECLDVHRRSVASSEATSASDQEMIEGK